MAQMVFVIPSPFTTRYVGMRPPLKYMVIRQNFIQKFRGNQSFLESG